MYRLSRIKISDPRDFGISSQPKERFSCQALYGPADVCAAALQKCYQKPPVKNSLPETMHGEIIRTTSRSSRLVLTEVQAVEIYRMKFKAHDHHCEDYQRCKSHSRLVAERYGVSPKTVRDVWNQKTWVHSTMHITCDQVDLNLMTEGEKMMQVRADLLIADTLAFENKF
jgi:hypothetical protein